MGRIVSAALSAAAVAAVAGLARLLFDRQTALLAAAMAAVYPEAIALGAFVLSEAPFTPLMMAHLILWALAWRASSPHAPCEEPMTTEGTSRGARWLPWRGHWRLALPPGWRH